MAARRRGEVGYNGIHSDNFKYLAETIGDVRVAKNRMGVGLQKRPIDKSVKTNGEGE